MTTESTPLILCWSIEGHEPVACECEVFGWPNFTTTGHQMFQNSHYLDREEAWAHIERSNKIRLELAVSQLREARAKVAAMEVELIAVAVRIANTNAARGQN